MKLYSDFAVARTRQIVLDLLALAGIVIAIVAGVAVHKAILTLAAIGEQVEKAGTGFRSTMTDAGKVVAGIPLVGKGASTPFGNASDAGRTLADAGATEQAIVATSATVLALLVAAIPLYFVIRYLLVRRIRFVVVASKAARAARMPGAADLFALRALATADARSVLSLGPDVVSAWRAGEPATVSRLAGVELRRLGVRLPD